ncbi:hypothetical protein TNCV_4155501 [Trichonephila clavipes]|nr:hypothetical protein TNCV_4155501 [Trichonephila clavipes]
MDEDRTTKKVFNAQPIGARKKDRPKLRRVDGNEGLGLYGAQSLTDAENVFGLGVQNLSLQEEPNIFSVTPLIDSLEKDLLVLRTKN